MKNIKILSLIIIVIVSLTYISFAQPQIDISSGATYDWGNVRPGQNPLNGKFIIKNTGNDTLRITKVQPSCGCTSAPLQKYELAPNESTELNVSLNISSYEGHIEKYIDIYSNDMTAPQKRLTLLANIERIIKVEPGNVVSFMQMTVGKTQTQSVQIKNYGDKDVELTISEYYPKTLLLKFESPKILKKGESYPLDITINADKPGIIKGRILIKTNNSEIPELPIYIYGDIAPSPIFIGN
jgi:hypothetical protein